MSRRLVLAGALVALLWGSPLRAQLPFARDLVPTRTSLARLGLEKQWLAVIPVVGDERVVSLSMADDLVFVQTNKAYFHVLNAESGQLLWTARLGTQTAKARPASVNSFAVFVTNLNTLHALDRKTGHPYWVKTLDTLP
jgi:outer membrane protein assembly factor BamB